MRGLCGSGRYRTSVGEAALSADSAGSLGPRAPGPPLGRPNTGGKPRAVAAGGRGQEGRKGREDEGKKEGREEEGMPWGHGVSHSQAAAAPPAPHLPPSRSQVWTLAASN